MAELRPKIVKLARMVGGVAGAMNKIDEKAPEYYALNAVFTDEMADVSLVMGLRKPRTLGFITEKCGKSREEVREILKFAEDNGLMHEMPATDGLGESSAICNCCSCSCFSMRIATLFRTPDAIRSNFTAYVDPEECVACGQCVENCPTNALKLGQRLCAKNPLPREVEPTAREHVWGPKNWNKDYRENRQDVAKEGTAPCKTACPAHIAVQGYIKLAARGKYREALELIKKENPFPAVCGRICPHGCEDECTRGEIDEPIAIDEIKKFIADKELDSETRYIPPKRYHLGNKIAIVGAGPAGLACAYYLAIDDYKVTVFEKEEKLGGMLALGIPSFRLEKEVLNAEIDVLRELGVEFRTGVEVGSDVTLEELRSQGYEAFYLAVGAQGGRQLGVDGENADGVISGVDFLREVNLGHGQNLNGNAVVIGGGNVAVDVARTAARQGAGKVDMYCLESREEMPALKDELEEAERDQVEFHNGWGPKRILTENGKVTGVEFMRCISVFDKDGHFPPQYNTEETITVKADSVLVSIGQSIQWGNLLKGSKVKLGKGNTAKADGLTYQTDEPDMDVIREEGPVKVEKIVLEAGELSGVVPRYLEECWPAARYKTSMVKTELVVEIIPGIVQCRVCRRVFDAADSDMSCPNCGSQYMEILSGNDLMIKEILVL